MASKDITLTGVPKPPAPIRRIRSAEKHEINKRMRKLLDNFRGRASWFKSHVTRPLSPSATNAVSRGSESELDMEEVVKVFAKEVTGALGIKPGPTKKVSCLKTLLKDPIDPQGIPYIVWLFIVTCAFLYNVWSIPLRAVFPYQDGSNFLVWISLDYFCDSIYLVDLLLVRHRVQFLNKAGFYETDTTLLKKHYLKAAEFYMSALAIAPTDALYVIIGVKPVIRLNRFLKVQTLWDFFDRSERVVSDPHIIRIARTLIYMLYMVHINACAYYAVSVAEGIGTTSWVFQGEGNAYIRCFYLAFKTANSIGRNLKPTNNVEYIYMTISWLMGVFVFAFLIGQIRDIVATATKEQSDYQRLRDQVGKLLHRMNVPKSLRKKVNEWFSYTWSEQKCLDERDLLEGMPKKLREDVSLSVHLHTLSKVKLITECAGRDTMLLLRDLVLKLKPVTFLPGDFVCKKGEIGKEMYILKTGKLDVLGGDDGKTVLVTLNEGSVIGEISLLADSEGARRTRDVVSQGYSTLFALSKTDLTETIKDYPEAQTALRAKARDILQAHEAATKLNRWQEMFDRAQIFKQETKKKVPKVLEIFQQALPNDSYAAEMLARGKRARKTIKRRRNVIHPIDEVNNKEVLPPIEKFMTNEGRF